MPRTKEFVREEALENAMEVFWDRGYEATSVQNLLDRMGINRGSMYDTFGDKKALFAAAIEHYVRTIGRKVPETLDAPGSPLGNIRRLFREMVEVLAEGNCRGCLVTNTAVELAPHDPAIAAAVRSVLGEIERAFRRTLDRAVEAGELPPEANTRAMARYFTSTIQGLVVMEKASSGRAVIRDIVDIALTVLG